LSRNIFGEADDFSIRPAVEFENFSSDDVHDIFSLSVTPALASGASIPRSER
jgi:hypothetical protein